MSLLHTDEPPISHYWGGFTISTTRFGKGYVYDVFTSPYNNFGRGKGLIPRGVGQDKINVAKHDASLIKAQVDVGNGIQHLDGESNPYAVLVYIWSSEYNKLVAEGKNTDDYVVVNNDEDGITPHHLVALYSYIQS